MLLAFRKGRGAAPSALSKSQVAAQKQYAWTFYTTPGSFLGRRSEVPLFEKGAGRSPEP